MLVIFFEVKLSFLKTFFEYIKIIVDNTEFWPTHSFNVQNLSSLTTLSGTSVSSVPAHSCSQPISLAFFCRIAMRSSKTIDLGFSYITFFGRSVCGKARKSKGGCVCGDTPHVLFFWGSTLLNRADGGESPD